MCIPHRNYRNNILLKIKTDVPMVYNWQQIKMKKLLIVLGVMAVFLPQPHLFLLEFK